MGRTRRDQRLQVLTVNSAIADAIRGFGSGRVIPQHLIEAFLQTRRGAGLERYQTGTRIICYIIRKWIPLEIRLLRA